MKTNEEHWWNDTGPSHCITDRQSFSQSVIYSFSQSVIYSVSHFWAPTPPGVHDQILSRVLNTAISRRAPCLKTVQVCPLRWVTAFVDCVYLHTRITSHTEISAPYEYLNVSCW